MKESPTAHRSELALSALDGATTLGSDLDLYGTNANPLLSEWSGASAEALNAKALDNRFLDGLIQRIHNVTLFEAYSLTHSLITLTVCRTTSSRSAPAHLPSLPTV